MIVTPFHFSVGAPIHRHAGWRGVMLANIVADTPLGFGMIDASSGCEHYAELWKNPRDTPTHTLWAALTPTVLFHPIWRAKKWLCGVLAGAISHSLLDSLYHSGVRMTLWAQPGFLRLSFPDLVLDAPLLLGLEPCSAAGDYRPQSY